MFEFDDLCSATDCLLSPTSNSAHESVSSFAFEWKPLPNSLKYSFLSPHESLPIIITFELD